MYLGYQLSSLYDEKSWNSDSFMKSSLYKIQNNQTSYGNFSSSDYVDYYQFSSGIGDYTIYVTGDPSNDFAKSAYSSDFSIKILDSSGNDTGLTSSSYDLYTKSISYTAKSDSTYYLEIKSFALSNVSYAMTLKSDYDSSTSSTNTAATSKTTNGTDGNDSLIGTTGTDLIYGFGGADTIDGGLGIDFMYGGLGDDYYFVDNNIDSVHEEKNEGTDVVFTDFSYLLPSNVENSYYYGIGGKESSFGAIEQLYADFDPKMVVLGGNELDNRIMTSDDSGAVIFSGLGGNDTLVGSSKNDIFTGDEGNDFIDGKLGTKNVATYHSNKIDYVLTKNGTTYTISGGTNGTDTLTNIQFLKFKDGTVAIDSMLTPVNHAPAGNPVGFGVGNEDTNYTLNSTDLLNGFNDADFDTLSVTNLTATNGKTTANADGTWLLSPNANFNGTVQLNYTVSDSKGGLTNAVIDFVLNSVNDAPTGTVSIVGKAKVGETLSVQSTLDDVDGINTLNFTWLGDGEFLGEGEDFLLTNDQKDLSISVVANYVDDYGNIEEVHSEATENVIALNHAPTGIIIIKGDAQIGSTLLLTNTISDTDGLGEFSYSWDTNVFYLSSDDKFIVTPKELGQKIWATVSYTDGAGNYEEIKSEPTTAVTIAKTSTMSSAGNDLLTGTNKADKILGLTGDDTLIGGLGKDTLTGGTGFDELTGGAGADKFIFTDIKDAPLSRSKIDIIVDFSSQDGDKIELSSIDANTSIKKDQSFSKPVSGEEFSGEFAKAGQLFFETSTHILYGNVNKDSAADFAIQLNGISKLTARDFIL